MDYVCVWGFGVDCLLMLDCLRLGLVVLSVRRWNLLMLGFQRQGLLMLFRKLDLLLVENSTVRKRQDAIDHTNGSVRAIEAASGCVRCSLQAGPKYTSGGHGRPKGTLCDHELPARDVARA